MTNERGSELNVVALKGPRGSSVNIPSPKPQVLVFPTGDMIGGVIHACKAWGRTQVWIQTNTDRYGNEDGWPQSIAGRVDQSIQAGGFFSSKTMEAMHGDALAVSRACRGMPELAYLVLFMQYVVVKARQLHHEWKVEGTMYAHHDGKTFEVPRQVKVPKFGDWYRVPVKTKAKDLGIGTNDYYKHLNGAHMWIGARLETVRTE